MGTPQGVDLYSYEDSLWGDLLTYWGDDRIVYDEIGNPTMIGYYYEGDWYGGYVMTWKGRQMMSCMNVDLSTMLNFTYNADGIRTSKTVEGVEHRYTLSGSQIISESWEEGGVEHLLIYIYDENGSPIGLKYRTDSYAAERYNYFFFEKNLQGDIVAIYNENGSKIGTYVYDAWGGCTVVWMNGTTSLEKRIVGVYNPFRYRGYYYDVETGWYYLQSRYYNPEWGRFLNADGQLNCGLLGYNQFSYCGSNPVNFIDPNGTCPYNGTSADFHRLEYGLPPMDCTCRYYGMSDDEATISASGRYTSYDRCLDNAIKMIEERYLTDPNCYEHAVFIYKDAQGYYCISVIYHTTSTSSVNVCPWKVRDKGATIVAFIHTHPHDKNQYVFNDKEIGEMNPSWRYYVVAIDTDHTSLYCYTPHAHGTVEDTLKIWEKERR